MRTAGVEVRLEEPRYDALSGDVQHLDRVWLAVSQGGHTTRRYTDVRVNPLPAIDVEDCTAAHEQVERPASESRIHQALELVRRTGLHGAVRSPVAKGQLDESSVCS